MTKKFLFGTMAAAMMFASSCSNEIDVVTPTDGEATVTVGLSIPQKQMGSRAFSDGTKADKLQYAVYEKDGSTLNLLEGMSKIGGDAAEDIKIQTQVPFRLLNDHTYVFVFWAANEEAPYEVNFGDNGEVTMEANYDGVVANNENLDAFYTVKEIKVTGSTKMEAELYRPFAQINIGTNDLKDMANQEHEVKAVTVTVNKAYKSFDLMTGYVTGSAETITFASAGLPQGETFPVAGYDYLAMNYVLVGQEDENNEAQKLVTVEFKATNEKGETNTRSVGYVPIQRNYRTNIFGQIFTSDIELNVEIKPDYEKPDYNGQYQLASTGGTVVLEEDVEINRTMVYQSGKTSTIDLNGHTITFNESYPFDVRDNTTLIIKGDGKVISTSASSEIIIVYSTQTTAATLIIEGGDFESPRGELFRLWCPNGQVTNGSIYIKGGTFKSTTNGDKNYIKSDPEEGSTATVEVTGGKFYNWDPSKYVTEDYKVVETQEGDDIVYTVVPADTDVIDVPSSMTQDEFDAAITGAAKAIINLGDDVELKLPSNSLVGKTFTFVGKGEGSILNSLNYETATGANLTFENMTLQVAKGGSSTSIGFPGVESLVLKDVTVKGEFHTFTAKDVNIDGCTFLFDEVNTKDRQGIWVDAYGKTVISNCTFDVNPPEGNGNETKAILIYSDNNFNMGDVEVTKCTFKGDRVSAKAAVEIHSEKFQSAGTITITGCTYYDNIYQGGLWREINNTAEGKPATQFFTIIVDGEVKQTGNN